MFASQTSQQNLYNYKGYNQRIDKLDQQAVMDLIWPIVSLVLAALLGLCFYLVMKLNQALKSSLAREEKAYSELLDNPSANPNPVLRINKMGVLLYANPAAALFLYHWKIVLNQKLPAQWREMIRQVLLSEKPQSIEYVIDKHFFTVNIVPITHDSVSLFGLDVTKQKKVEKQLERLTTTDEVTNLPNRVIFTQNVGLEMNHAKAKQQKFGVYIVRQDDYFEILNTYGQKVADRFIQMFAGRLGELSVNQNAMARISENEFAVLVPDCSDPAKIASLASAVIEQCTSGYKIGELEIFTTISIGIAFFPGDGEEADVLIRNAQLAVNRTSSTRNQFEFFQRGMVDQLQIKRSIISDLYKALDQNQFMLYYQPQVNLSKMEMQGCEALIRWNHPEKGFISPFFFMPAAEETQLIIPIGDWVIRRACEQIVQWQRSHQSAIKVAVNISAQQLFQGDLVTTVRQILRETGANPDQLELELTETALARDIPTAIEIMKKFKEMGISLALDDFGTGYSSLNYLMQFPVSKIKIDRSFIKAMEEKENQNHALVKGIIDLAHSLHLKVVAEGVETKTQLRYMQQYQCDVIQGYYFAQPQPPDKFATFFKQNWKA